MGTYTIKPEDIVDEFETFLQKASLGKGDITSYTIITAWNMLSNKYGWNDKIITK